MSSPISIAFPAGNGVNNADEPVFFNASTRGNFIQQATNLRIEHNRWRTRYRVIGQPVVGIPATLKQWQQDNSQNAVWYIPQNGQGTHYIGKGPSKIVESAAGRLYTLTPTNNGFLVEDISGGTQAYPYLRLAWLEVAENYVIRTDGQSQTQFWDGSGTVFGSPGYNASAKERSRFPNAAGPVVYAGGRLYATVFGRRILVSDSLHQSDQIGATDLLKFTDQSYDITNVYFAPPASEQDIVALTVSVSSSGSQDISRAQGEVMSMCEGPAIWAIALGVPRDQWATSQMRKTRSKETAASGPNAFSVRDGDILMRTSRGIESLNLLARERQDLGNAVIDLGADMRKILHADDEESLIFCSLINPIRWSRMLCTVGPVINGPRHYHLGWIAANWNPLSVRQPSTMAWEGVCSLDKRLGRVIQFLPSVTSGKTRVVALVDREDGASKGVVEMTEQEGNDQLDDGTAIPIQWSLLTHKLVTNSPVATTGFSSLYLYLHDIRSDLKLSIYARDDKQPFQHHRTISVKFNGTCGDSVDKKIVFGKPTAAFRDSRWIQFMLVGEGVVSPDILTQVDSNDGANEQADPDCVEVQGSPLCSVDPFKMSR
jgi:hypothetical protein